MAMSSASSSRTPSSSFLPRNHWIDGRSGGGGGASGCDSCYYPGCRKDANCHCDICVASFNATRDLIHSSTSIIKPKPKTKTKTKTKTIAARDAAAFPSSFDSDTSTPPSTPSSEPPDVSSLSVPSSASPLPTPRRNKCSNSNKGENNSSLLPHKLLVLAVVTLAGLWLFDSGFLMILSRSGGGPKLAPDMVRGFGEGARAPASGFRGALGTVERKLGGVVGVAGVSNCSSMDSLWKLNQEGGHHFFFLWRCVIYRTAAEELSVWGSPLQTSGLLVAGASSRSITLLSGRITEWSDAKLVPVLRTGNSSSSWMLGKWSSVAVQLERETWVLEYQRSAMFQGPGLIRTARDILRLRLQTLAKRLKLRLLVGTSSVAGSYYRDSGDRNPHFEHPT